MERTQISLVGRGEGSSESGQPDALHRSIAASFSIGGPSTWRVKTFCTSNDTEECMVTPSDEKQAPATDKEDFSSCASSAETTFECPSQDSSSSDPLLDDEVQTTPFTNSFGDEESPRGGGSKESGSNFPESTPPVGSSLHSTSSSEASSISSDDSSDYSDSCSSISFDDDLAMSLSTFLTATSDRRRHTVVPVAESARLEPPERSASLTDSGIDTFNEEHMLAIKEDLLKVGNMFASQQCEGFRERARVLASINYLSRHVPSCVLDHLGREIRSGQPTIVPVDQDSSPLNQSVSINSSDTEGDWDCSATSTMDVSECQSSVCRQTSQTTFFSASSQEGVILGLPYVSPSYGAVLFVDIAGFTSLSARVGSENISRLLNEYFEAIISVVFSFGGDIQKFAGDAFFADWKVTPCRARDECAKLAALCSCKIARDFENYQVKVKERTFADVEVVELNSHFGLGIGEMTGIHIGDSEHRRQYLNIGCPIVQATSTCNLAGRGEVVVSSEFYEIALNMGLQDVVCFTRNQSKVSMKACGDEFDHCVDQLMKKPGGNARSRAITEHVEGLEVSRMKEYQRLISLYCHPVEQAGVASFSTMSTMSTLQQQTDICEREMRNVFVAFLNAPLTVHDVSSVVNDTTVQKINRVFNLVSHELIHSNGYLESFIDDKGFSLMITFGLRGSWFPDLVSAVALPAVLTVEETLSAEEGIKCHIGATFGNVHCGFLGSNQRHEYTVLGPSVNLAARLMTNEMNDSLLVDQSVRDSCRDTQAFTSIGCVTAKGYSDPIMTYRPIAKKLQIIRPLPENRSFVGRQKELDQIVGRSNSHVSSIVMIEGMSGLGKSALLLNAASAIVEKGKRSNAVQWEHIVGDPKLSSVPFGALRAFVQSMIQKLQNRVGLDKEVLHEVRRVMDIPLTSTDKQADCPRKERKQLTRSASQICRVLTMGLVGLERLIVSIKDCHRLDAFSWRTLVMLLEADDRVFLLGSTTITALTGFRMDEETGDLIFGTFARTDRLTIMKLDVLAIEDVKQMVSESLGVDVVENNLLHSIYAESGGRPLYVEKILERLNSSGKTVLCEDLIVDQLDRLSSESRQCLAVGACLGVEFTSGEVKHILELDAAHCLDILEALVDDKILREHRKSASIEVAYSFLDDRWRQKLLDITLESAQQEIKRLAATANG